MDQRVSVITLGVADVDRSRAFYEALGWKLTFTDGDIVMFQAGPMVVSLWGRDQLAEDSGDAAAAGATITRQPVEKPFGYSGVFADPDGHTWEVAYIQALAIRDDGTVAMPS
jgi:predicted lactoylglutathione lyase